MWRRSLGRPIAVDDDGPNNGSSSSSSSSGNNTAAIRAALEELTSAAAAPNMARLRGLLAQTTDPAAVLGERVYQYYDSDNPDGEQQLTADTFLYFAILVTKQFAVAAEVLRWLIDPDNYFAAADKGGGNGRGGVGVITPEVLRQCLRDAADGRSLMQCIAAAEETDAIEGSRADDEVGVKDTAVDLLHAAYMRLAEVEGADSLDREKVDLPYHAFYSPAGELLHPGPPTDTRSQTDAHPPRLSIVVCAHGVDVVTSVRGTPNHLSPIPIKKFGPLSVEKIAMLYYGPGKCDMSTNANDFDFLNFEYAVWEATRPHRPNTLETMEELQPRLREMYTAQVTKANADEEEKKVYSANAEASAIIAANQHCRIANPVLDHNYSFKKFGAVLCMVQCFNSPYNDLVGKNLFGPEMRRRMRVHHPAVANTIDLWLKQGRLTYRGTARDLNLSHIANVVAAMGFEALNVYNYSCRDLFAEPEDEEAHAAVVLGTPKKRKHVAERVNYRERRVHWRAYGGGGGGTRKSRRRQRMNTATAATAAAAAAKTRRRRRKRGRRPGAENLHPRRRRRVAFNHSSS